MKAAWMKMELVFWDATIPLLSESTIVRKLVRQGYHLIHDKNLAWLPTIVLVSSFLGILTGYILGATGVIVW